MAETQPTSVPFYKNPIVWLIASALVFGAIGFCGGVVFEKHQSFRPGFMMQQPGNFYRNGRKPGYGGPNDFQRQLPSAPAATPGAQLK